MNFFESHPLIKNAVVEMAYDNGLINRLESEQALLKRMDGLLQDEDTLSEDTLYELESTLGKLTADEQRRLVTDSDEFVNSMIEEYEELEGELIHAHEVLNKIFEMM